jgi:hypothetical protein
MDVSERHKATPERWQRALLRGLKNGLDIRQVVSTGQWVCPSSSDLDRAHEVTLTECSCEACMHGDLVCQHRALLAYKLGVLDFAPLEHAR